MAEGFARAYGGDVMIASSAGLWPAGTVAPDTIWSMQEKNIDIRSHFPKSYQVLAGNGFDVIVNMSGYDLPKLDGTPRSIPIVDWKVQDPIGLDRNVYRGVRDQIEDLVMHLILDFRRKRKKSNP